MLILGGEGEVEDRCSSSGAALDEMRNVRKRIHLSSCPFIYRHTCKRTSGCSCSSAHLPPYLCFAFFTALLLNILWLNVHLSYGLIYIIHVFHCDPARHLIGRNSCHRRHRLLFLSAAT